MPEKKPLVSATELEALIQGWGSIPHQSIDRFFPIRFWFLFLLAFNYVIWLLFAPDYIAQTLSKEPIEIARLGRFLYFRGWFLAGIIFAGVYAYIKNFYIVVPAKFIFRPAPSADLSFAAGCSR